MLIFDKSKDFFEQEDLDFLKKEKYNNNLPLFLELGYLNFQNEFDYPSNFFFQKLKILFHSKINLNKKKKCNLNLNNKNENSNKIISVKINNFKSVQIKISNEFSHGLIINQTECNFKNFTMLLLEEFDEKKFITNYRIILINKRSSDKFKIHCTLLFIWDLFLKIKILKIKKST